MSDFNGSRTTDPLSPSETPDTRNPDPAVRRRYLGKFRGTVVQNIDPLSQGRIQVQVPGVGGILPSTWAMPCLPLANIAAGMYARPVIGSGVWVEFEAGDPNYPIWVGGYWGTPETLPTAAQLAVTVPPVTPVITIETLTGGLSISDTPLAPFGNVCLRSGASQIVFTPAGIQITAPSVTFQTAAFSINGTAFTVVSP